MGRLTSSKAIKTAFIGILGGLAAGLLLFGVSQVKGPSSKYMEQVERLFYDLLFKLEHVYTLDNLILNDTTTVTRDSTLEPRIQIVDIDERALAKLGTYNTWPRSHHADVVRYLADGGASAITFDILFKTATFGELDAQKALDVMKKVKPEEEWDLLYPLMKTSFNYDSMLVQSVKDAKHVVVCATMAPRNVYEHHTQWEPLSTEEWQKQLGTKGTLSAKQVPAGSSTIWDLLDNVFPELASATPYLGLVNVIPDDDGVHRKEPLFHGFPNPELARNSELRYYPLITVQTVAMLFGISPEDIIVKPGEYVDMGKPLGITKLGDGRLKTSYPNLSWFMIREILRNKELIQKIGPDSTQLKTLEVTHQVIVSKDVDGIITAEINSAQTVTAPMLSALRESPRWDSLAKLALKETVSLSHQVFLNFDSSSQMLRMVDTDENKVLFSSYSLEVLRESFEDLDSLLPGKKVYLSGNLDLSWDAEKGSLTSSYIILTPTVLKELLSSDSSQFFALKPNETMRLGRNIMIPVNDELHMQVNYIGQYGTSRSKRAFKQISYYELVKKRVDPGSFQGKVFILGSTAPALFDLVSAPHEAEYPGVLVHANILENILNDHFLRIVKDHQQIWIILALALFCSIIAHLLTPVLGFLAMVAFSAIYLLIAMHFFEQGLYIGLARQELTIFLSFIVIMVIRYFFENKEKRMIEGMFKKFVAPAVINEMIEKGIDPEPGGKDVIATAYFTDIAGFSSFSEAIGNPKMLVALLNEYLGNMTDILINEKGTLDKFIGDAIVAIFGAPLPVEDHAQRACVVSLKMQKHILLLRQKWMSEGDKWPKLVHKMHMRIGINTGKMVVGFMGTNNNMNYTMMGDTVNLAARLESASKQYGVYIQVSDDTLQAIQPNTILSRPIDSIVVMGKTEPVLCHELLALKEDITPDLTQLTELWQKARQLYLEMQWDQAIQAFEACLPLEPFHPDKDPGSKTTPSHIFIKRCQQYKIHPPVPVGETWDGVFVATSK